MRRVASVCTCTVCKQREKGMEMYCGKNERECGLPSVERLTLEGIWEMVDGRTVLVVLVVESDSYNTWTGVVERRVVEYTVYVLYIIGRRQRQEYDDRFV